MNEVYFSYIHYNPTAEHWKLCNEPADYKYSTAKFYETDIDEFGFLIHIGSALQQFLCWFERTRTRAESGKWNLCNSPIDYLHNSARYYLSGEDGFYIVTDVQDE